MLGRQLSQADGSRTYSSRYDPAGRRTRLTHPDGFFVTQEYSATGELTKIRENGTFLLATYDYDDLGRRVRLTLGNGAVTDYGHDAVSRLQSLTHDLGGAQADYDNSVTFTYNPAGQIVTRVATNLAYAWTNHFNASSGSTFDGLNRPTGDAHDARPNRATDGTRTYAYDSENKGRGVPAAPWHYDPLGRLSGASTSPGAPPAIAHESYVDNLVAERVPGSSTVQRRHVFGPGVDEPIVWYEGSSRRFLQADERGSIVAVTSDTGALLAINRYDEYGQTESTSNAHSGRFLYTGQRYFGGFGLYHYKNRMYDPKVGRFMQPDPIGYAGGMNLYAYVGGDPVNFRDPLGLDCYNVQGAGSVEATSETEGTITKGRFYQACFQAYQGPTRFFGPDGSTGGGADEDNTIIVTARRRLIPPVFLRCRGPARILRGNTALEGKTGAFGPGMPVRLGSAAIIPRQFTGEPRAGPLLRSIGRSAFGWTDTGQSFFGFTDAIDHDAIASTAIEAQNILMARDPDRLIVEIVGAERDERTNINMIMLADAGARTSLAQL